MNILKGERYICPMPHSKAEEKPAINTLVCWHPTSALSHSFYSCLNHKNCSPKKTAAAITRMCFFPDASVADPGILLPVWLSVVPEEQT